MAKSKQRVFQMKIMRRSDINSIDFGIADKFFVTAVRFRDMKLFCKLFCSVEAAGTDGVEFGILDNLKCRCKFMDDPSCA